ncbi:U1 snRNA associated [Micractinium conductrix]|uniref:U1 snRNA associated n=1 Tax=Micractinium conductrix TaxID=554055 RepID=A0A2P6VA18_9CHLO|nr:U1 snRNA associated [Micractinium conductrix]|eukprot:PSC70918.1 U1 snRNA associated [Micractinium conductrix]
MADEMRAMLDQLMGKDRDVPLDQREVRDMSFSDKEVCKHALAGLCPFGLFPNTKSDLGPCEFELHEDHLDWDALKVEYDKLDEREKERYGYELCLLRLLSRLVSDMDRKIDKARERAALESRPKPLSPKQQAEVDGMRQQAKELTERSEKMAEDGDIDASMAAIAQAERLRIDADELTKRYTKPDRTMDVCEVCGVFIQNIDTAAGKQAHADHLEGKQYLGWLAIREKYKELQQKYGGGGAGYMPMNASTVPVAPRREEPAEEGEVQEERGGSRSGHGSDRRRSRSRDRRDRGGRDERRRSRSRERGGYGDRGGYGRSGGYDRGYEQRGGYDRGGDRDYDRRRCHSCTATLLKHRLLERRPAVTAAAGGKPGPPAAVQDVGGVRWRQLKAQLELFGAEMVMPPGPAVTGTLAVAAGYFLHTEALGGFHWSTDDAALGLQCGLAVMALDAALVLPDYNARVITKVFEAEADWVSLKLLTATLAAVAEKVAAGVAAGDVDEPDEDWIELSKTYTSLAEEHPFAKALDSVPLGGMALTEKLAFPLRLAHLLAWHLAREMLCRGVALTWATGWTIDRLYEAGAGETVQLPVLLGLQLGTPQAGAALAAAGCAAASLVVLVQFRLFMYKAFDRYDQEVVAEAARGQVDDSEEAMQQRMEAAVRRVRATDSGLLAPPTVDKEMEEVRKWRTAITGARLLVKWAAYSTPFLLTGNLLAPLVATCAADLLVAGYQLLKDGRVSARRLEDLQELKETVELLACWCSLRRQQISSAPTLPC